jgi:hypothetical protein
MKRWSIRQNQLTNKMGLQYLNNYLYLVSMADIGGLVALSPNIDVNRINNNIRDAQELDLRVFMGDAFYCNFINYFSNTGLASAILPTAATGGRDSIYTNQPVNTITGNGENATANYTISGGLITAFTMTAPGDSFAIGDTFNFDEAPEGIFTVSGLTPVFNPNTPEIITQLFYGCIYEDLSGNPINYAGMLYAIAYWSFARFLEFDSVQYTATGPVQKMHDASEPVKTSDVQKIVTAFRSKANASANSIEKFLYINKTSFPLWRMNQDSKNSRQPGARIRGIDRSRGNAGYGFGNGDYWGDGLGGFL